MSGLEHKIVLVTGGAHGLGRAIAQAFHQQGARVLIADRDENAARKVAAGLDGLPVAMDVADDASVEAGFALAEREWGTPTIVINNAGILSEKKPLHEISAENWRRVTEVNQNGPFYVMKAALPRMMAAGGGVIINMASTAAIAGVMNNGPYSAAKAALVRMTREAAVAYGPHNIRVNALAPGAVLTEAMEARIADAPDPVAYRESLNHLNPLPGMPDAADVAAAAVFLASDQARFISGAVLPVDGGYACR